VRCLPITPWRLTAGLSDAMEAALANPKSGRAVRLLKHLRVISTISSSALAPPLLSPTRLSANPANLCPDLRPGGNDNWICFHNPGRLSVCDRHSTFGLDVSDRAGSRLRRSLPIPAAVIAASSANHRDSMRGKPPIMTLASAPACQAGGWADVQLASGARHHFLWESEASLASRGWRI